MLRVLGCSLRRGGCWGDGRRMDCVTWLKKTLQMKALQVEILLQQFVGDLTPEEIKQRCKCVRQGLNLEQYFCDDKLLFEVEFIPGELKWQFRGG